MISFKQTLGGNLKNAIGWRTNRKIIVIESDDWGSIRMPSKDVRDILINKHPHSFYGGTYDRVDNLANERDLAAIFDVLSKFKDKNGNHPIITANTVVANPDFIKIKEIGYQKYFWEPFTLTLKGYKNHQNTFNLWKEGIEKGMFLPQFHSREHIDVAQWMLSINSNEQSALDAFDCGTWIMKRASGERIDVAYNYTTDTQLAFILKSIEEGATLFQEIFGYKSKSFIAPAYTWDNKIEEKFNDLGFKYIQGGLYQIFPAMYNKKRINYTGRENEFGQIYLMRNVHFEPALTPLQDCVPKALLDIERAFRWRKPAIISSHRLNYIGNLEEQNRINTLNQLQKILSVVVKKYPDVEFMTSDKLGDAIVMDKA
jgi:hypothetical protein